MTDGRLFMLRLSRNAASRQAALASVAPAGAVWTARLGGAVRGTTYRFRTRDAAVRAVHDHYNAALMRHVTEQNRSRDGVHA